MEVLIFKMAVATGFDAPRAFVLCALRAVADAGFGLQVVGRIMRVHPLLQPRTDLPLALDTGWVFLGDADGQAGLQSAAQRIQSIRDGIAVTTDSVHVVNVEANAAGNIVVVDENGQHEFVLEPDPDPPEREITPAARAERAAALFTRTPNLFAGLAGFSEPEDDAPTAASSDASPVARPPPPRAMPMLYRYPRRAGVIVPASLRTEKMPRDTKLLLTAIARAVRFTSEQLLAARRATLPIERREEELFEGRMARRMEAQGVISDLFATQAAHKVLSVCDHIPVADLGRALMARLSSQLQEQGQEPLDEKALRRALHLILGQWPEITREALRRAMASCAEVIDAAPLPEFWESDTRLPESPLNLYAVLPQGLNTWEQPFAEWLDQQEGTILWWIRNHLARTPPTIGLSALCYLRMAGDSIRISWSALTDAKLALLWLRPTSG
jgi:type III restriction enzyme